MKNISLVSNLVIAAVVSFGTFSVANALVEDKAFEYTCVSADGVHTALVKSVPNRPFFANEAFSPTVYTTIRNRSTRETRKEKLYDGWYKSGDYMVVTYEGQTMFARYASSSGKMISAELFCSSLKASPKPIAKFEIKVSSEYPLSAKPYSSFDKRYVNGIAIKSIAKNPDFPTETKVNWCSLVSSPSRTTGADVRKDTTVVMTVYPVSESNRIEIKGRTTNAEYSGTCEIGIAVKGTILYADEQGMEYRDGTAYLQQKMTDFNISAIRALVQSAFPKGMVRF